MSSSARSLSYTRTTSSYRIMPTRKSAMKRKSASRLACQLHLQETRQQRPFSESRFGRLPGELREMIYEYVLVAPPSQSTRYLCVPVNATTTSDVAPNEEAISNTVSRSSAGYPQRLLADRDTKVSYLAILQTCRQINREAYHIFYAKNCFHVPNAPVLIAFLTGIGLRRRAELTSLSIEGLVIERCRPKDKTHRYCLANGIDSAREERLANTPLRCLHPDLLQYQTKDLFKGCKNLSRLVLDMPARDGYDYLRFLRSGMGLERSMIYLVDESHWIVVLLNVDQPLFPPSFTTFLKYMDLFPCWAWRNQVRVEINIIRALNELVKKEIQSWAFIV